VISTRKRLISPRRVRFPHEESDFTRRVWFYSHENTFDKYACENDTHECNNDTHECDSTRRVQVSHEL
jgi:hypothetical protein